MKKLALIAVVAGFAFASCKKDYTCTCTADGYSASTTFHSTKKDAKTACDNNASGMSGVTCTLN